MGNLICNSDKKYNTEKYGLDSVKKQSQEKSHLDNQYGFTLVEIVVVITILAILGSLSVLGLMRWQESSDFKQQNEYAQILFISAQNQLADYENTQKIDRFAEMLKDSDGNMKRLLDVTQLTDGKGTVYASDDAVWYEAEGSSGTEASKYRGELCYAACTVGDYENYQKGALDREAKDRGADIVFLLLEQYVYDKSILNAAISIEFSPREAQVFALCYRAKGGEFVYLAPSETAAGGRINIANREEGYRREWGIGYYGTDTLAKATADRKEKLIFAQAELKNEETLHLLFSVAQQTNSNVSLTYKIKIFDAEEERLVLSFDLDGAAIRSYADRSPVSAVVTRYLYDGGGVSPIELGTYEFPAWRNADGTVCVVLDAADGEAGTKQYLYDAAYLGRAGSDSKKFAKTYSFHRFGLDTENIYCTLQAAGGTYRASAEKQTQAQAVYFASAKWTKEPDGTQVFCYQLSNGRHLYNVRYAEDCSMTEMTTLSEKIDSSKPWQFQFQVTNLIDWKDFTENGNFYRSDAGILPLPPIAAMADGRKPVTVLTEICFPSLLQLRYGDSFSGAVSNTAGNTVGNTAAQIRNLQLSQEKNEIFGVYRTAAQPVGLFLTNSGTIANLVLEEIQVTGEEDVGAFCGINRGHLQDLAVKGGTAGSRVSGQKNVGGIAGYHLSIDDSAVTSDKQATAPVLTGLVNEAGVSGCEAVGGIIGKISIPAQEKQPQVTLRFCENRGAVTAVNSAAVAGGSDLLKKQKEPKYIGGIVGYCDNHYVDSQGKKVYSRLKVANCVSQPEYPKEELARYLETAGSGTGELGNVLQEGYTGAHLKGICTGGIVGYNFGASIEECSTLAEKENTGYVFGYQYVGGIVGFNQGIADGRKSGAEERSVNQAHVIGVRYVGGITGCNAQTDGTTDSDGVIQPEKSANYEIKADSWRNEGIVFAKEDYAGGISGYHTGWLYHCDSRVKINRASGFDAEVYGRDYAGGITGYSNGIIGNTERVVSENGKKSAVKEGADTTQNIDMDCLVSGKSYVGGIVGYNDVDSRMENYRLTGGRILGSVSSGLYVGGYAGFNASVHLLRGEGGGDARITANPEEVTGRYFVGGTIGGNIVNTIVNSENADSAAVAVSSLSIEFLGDNPANLTAEAFVGGLIGYNVMLESGERDAAVIWEQALTEGVKQSDSRGESLAEKVKLLDGMSARQGLAGSECRMIINGTDDGSEPQNSSGKITAGIYAGGVMGYNDLAAAVTFQNIRNVMPVAAGTAVRNAGEQPGRTVDYAGRTMEFAYSYAGGILGKAGPKVVIEHCRNTATGKITAAGTYTGGLCEINEGKITNCEVSAIHWASDNYTGGFCGINKAAGVIDGCGFKNQSITVQNAAGGFAAENFGVISDITVQNATIVLTGDTDTDPWKADGLAAAVAGYNAETGTILLNRDLGAIHITSYGRCVGGVAGYNAGEVQNRKPDKETAKLSVGAGGTITAGADVGGVIGYNDSSHNTTAIEFYVNQAVITGKKGNAGGIVGRNACVYLIYGCENKGVVSAAGKDGNVGGITADNMGNIEKCVNYANLFAPEARSGGIAAVNQEGAKIRDCLMRPVGETGRLTVAALRSAGAIAAENAGLIQNCRAMRVTVENYPAGSDSNIGIVAGVNQAGGMIALAADADTLTDCLGETYSDYSRVGGVAGINYGMIRGEMPEGQSLPSTMIRPVIRFKEDSGTIASFGGVAGCNLGVIEKISVQGVIGHASNRTEERLLGAETTGYGGIAGFNGYAESASAATEAVIKNCTFDGTVWAHGSASAAANIGGIAGTNGYGGFVRECAVGVAEGETHIWGGDIPKQHAWIDSLEKNADTPGKAILQNGEYCFLVCADSDSYTYIGGIAGVNYGTVSSCDNAKYAGVGSRVKIESLFGQSGGITGIACAGAVVTGTKNKPLSTGAGWTIEAYAASENTATGGIAGSFYSGHSIEYAINHAAVRNRYYAETAVGGLLGAVLQKESSGLTISDCVNDGYVLGTSYVAGMAGLNRFQGMNFINCENSGVQRVQAGVKVRIAGFVASADGVDTDLSFRQCRNTATLRCPDREKKADAFVAFLSGAGTIKQKDCEDSGQIEEYSIP